MSLHKYNEAHILWHAESYEEVERLIEDVPLSSSAALKTISKTVDHKYSRILVLKYST